MERGWEVLLRGSGRCYREGVGGASERDGRCYGTMERGWEVLWRGGGRCF